MERLRRRISELLSEAQVRSRTQELEHELLDACQFAGIVGRSALMLDVFAKLRRIAPHFRTVLVTGPTGTGKELVARALHHLSSVASGPFAGCKARRYKESDLRFRDRLTSA